MKTTGLVRRIDDLGRIVIPKEIRRTMRIREGTPLEIYTDGGAVTFKKYSPVGELSDFTAEYAEAVYKSGGVPVAICDTDSVVAVAGVSKKEYVDKPISEKLAALMSSRKSYAAADGDDTALTDGGTGVSYFSPIISEGNVIGGIMSLKVGDRTADVIEKKLVDAGAYFISSQSEI